jgi:phosphoribosylformylglycinamidine (FGAM) synthase-like enzyme
VAEASRNLACTGARPLALVNCLNFGNPENPTVMWQVSEAVDGMAEACRALALPVVGGNVSLYNATGGADILPTPTVMVVGLIDDLEQRIPGLALPADGLDLVLLGTDDGAAVMAAAARRGVVARRLGHSGGGHLDFGVVNVGLDAAGAAWRSTLPGLMR